MFSIITLVLGLGIVIGIIAFVVPPITILWKKWVAWLEKKLNQKYKDY